MFQIDHSTHEGMPALRLVGELNIYSVTEARDQLCAALDQQAVLRLSLAGLEEVDTSGIQLLVWLKQEAERLGKSLVLFAHSPAVVEGFDLLKVTGLFGDAILLAPSVA